MDPSKRNAAALHDRVNTLCDALITHYTTLLTHARPSSPSQSTYSSTAQIELSIREDSTSLVKTTQDLAMLVRDLQELWLFGSLDTVVDRRDEGVMRERVREVAQMVERLAGKRSGNGEA